MDITLTLSEKDVIVLFDALQNYQAENVGMIHGWTITEATPEYDVELFTSLMTVWGTVENLKNIISNALPENPAF